MIGITSFGAYIPRLRLDRMAIFRNMGWFAPAVVMVAQGERAMCNWDEDAVTMAVAAARDCLTGRDKLALDGLYLGSTTLPFADRQNAGIVATALNLRADILTLDVTGSQRAGTAALLAGLEAVMSGERREILVAAADRRETRTGYFYEMWFGDGAAALSIGAENVVAAFKGSHSVSYDFVDHYRAAGRRFDYVWEERWARDEGYARIIPEAVNGLLAKLGLSIGQIDRLVYPCIFKAEHRNIARGLGAAEDRVAHNLHEECGETGTAHPLLMLVAALEKARAGDRILVAGFWQGCSALLFEVTEQIEGLVPRNGVAGSLKNRQPTDFLDLTLKTGTRELKGVVVEKAQAEERYEDAVTDGDTAIMLEQVEPGLYTMNVGNLQPGETVDITIAYAELLKWRDDSLRFFLPTTVAPRYGDPVRAGVQPHQAPEYDLCAGNPFSVSVTISGVLAGAAVECPSHGIVTERRGEDTVVRLEKAQALMDRDFVLEISMQGGAKGAAQVQRDGEGYVALASFYPRLPAAPGSAPRCLTIVVDCSGSMGGDSIAQARGALLEILGLLRPRDRFNVIRFGSSLDMLFETEVPADGANLEKAQRVLEVLDADMGGTEIGQAVRAAVRAGSGERRSKEVLLITDGEVWDWQEVTAMAARSGHRFFTVGVGSSVSEAFVQRLAEVTGGACELVSPRENMAEKIVRHFKRIFFPKAGNVRIIWPGEPQKVLPENIGPVYDGDTLHVFARFRDRPEGFVELRAGLENGEALAQKLRLRDRGLDGIEAGSFGTAARVAAALEIAALEDPEAIAALGVKYQLMTRFTNCLAVDVRAEGEKAADLPALRKTPQVLAAGWGGAGRVADSDVCFSISSEDRVQVCFDHLYLPVQRSFESLMPAEQWRRQWFFERLNGLDAESFARLAGVGAIAELAAHAAPEALIDALRELRDDGVEERTAVVTFLYLLSQENGFKRDLSRSARRMIARAYKQLPPVPEGVNRRVRQAVELYLQTMGS